MHACRGDFIVVGDIMRSFSLLMYKAEEGTLELRAQVRVWVEC